MKKYIEFLEFLDDNDFTERCSKTTTLFPDEDEVFCIWLEMIKEKDAEDLNDLLCCCDLLLNYTYDNSRNKYTVFITI